MKHRHQAIKSVERCFTGCVAPRSCNPVAHGGVVFCETCSCGAVRATASNGGKTETSGWCVPEADSQRR